MPKLDETQQQVIHDYRERQSSKLYKGESLAETLRKHREYLVAKANRPPKDGRRAQQTRELKALGQRALVRIQGPRPMTLREIGMVEGVSHIKVWRALRAIGADAPPSTTRAAQRAALIELGEKAIAMIDCGLSMKQIQKACNTSKPRIYRALHAASVPATTGLSEWGGEELERQLRDGIDPMLL